MKQPYDASLTIRLMKTLREAAHKRATERNEDLSEVLREFLRRYTK